MDDAFIEPAAAAIKSTPVKKLIIGVVNVINVLLVVAKGCVAYISGSYSISTSAIESFADVFVGILILIQNLANQKSTSSYPRGRKTDATTCIVASCVMLTLASVNIIHSIEAILTGKLNPDLNWFHVGIVILNIAAKVMLALLCRLKKDDDDIQVLYRDQITDVFTNLIASLSTGLAFYFYEWIDFIGAVMIFAVIVYNWGKVIHKTWGHLQGAAPSKKVSNEIEETLNEIRDQFSTMSVCITYHVGSNCNVEIYGDLIDNCSSNRKKIIELLEENNRIATAYLLPAMDTRTGESLESFPLIRKDTTTLRQEFFGDNVFMNQNAV